MYLDLFIVGLLIFVIIKQHYLGLAVARLAMGTADGLKLIEERLEG